MLISVDESLCILHNSIAPNAVCSDRNLFFACIYTLNFNAVLYCFISNKVCFKIASNAIRADTTVIEMSMVKIIIDVTEIMISFIIMKTRVAGLANT